MSNRMMTSKLVACEMNSLANFSHRECKTRKV